MPTAITHALVGAALAAAAPERLQRRRLVMIGGVFALVPDLDVAGFALGIPYDSPLGHRGLSHSLVFAALAGLAACALFARLELRRRLEVACLLGLVTASHGLLDACTDGGLGVGFLVPFSSRRFFFPWRPIAVSPIGVTAFLDGGARHVLASELRWIWLPTLVLTLGRLACRRRAQRARPSRI